MLTTKASARRTGIPRVIHQRTNRRGIMTIQRNHEPENRCADQRDPAKELEALYNEVDHFLRRQFRAENCVSFVKLVEEYADKHSTWRDRRLLCTIADLRNLIVHTRTATCPCVAVPSPAIMADLRRCCENLLHPKRVESRFLREVAVVRHDHSLLHVLREIKETDYSQFPVLREGRFCGLLTENGITRWLAQHVACEMSLVEFSDAVVEQVLGEEEKRKNCRFVSRKEREDRVAEMFKEDRLLEAVLITTNGKRT